jgi:hypothetical protein
VTAAAAPSPATATAVPALTPASDATASSPATLSMDVLGSVAVVAAAAAAAADSDARPASYGAPSSTGSSSSAHPGSSLVINYVQEVYRVCVCGGGRGRRCTCLGDVCFCVYVCERICVCACNAFVMHHFDTRLTRLVVAYDWTLSRRTEACFSGDVTFMLALSSLYLFFPTLQAVCHQDFKHDCYPRLRVWPRLARPPKKTEKVRSISV